MKKEDLINKINQLPSSEVKVADKINASEIKEILLGIANLLGTGGGPSIETPPEDQNNLSEGLIAHWKMDESAGSLIADQTKNNDGTHYGLLHRESAPENTSLVGALGFDGGDDFIQLGSIDVNNKLSLFDTDFTIAFWMKPSGTGDSYQRILDKSNNSNAKNGYALYIQGGHLYLMTNGVSTATALNYCSNNQWQHVVLVCSKDSTNHILYKNAVSFELGTKGAVSIPSATTNARIGTWNHSNGREFNGALADFRIWNRKLTQEEVELVYGIN